MTDIIWQQHNYHRNEPQNNKVQLKHYGPEQPERIHFNVSDDHIKTIQFSIQDSTKHTFSSVNNKSDSETVNKSQPPPVSGQDLLLDRRTNTVNSKWSIATDDNQNQQVCFQNS